MARSHPLLEEQIWLESVRRLQRFLASKPGMGRDAHELDRKLKWVTTYTLDLLQESFLAGNNWALPEAIFESAQAGLPLPNWAAVAFFDGLIKVEEGEVRSWNDVLGVPDMKRKQVKGKRALRARENLRKGQDVYQRIKRRAPDESIGDDLFDKVGQEFRISKASCNRLYYEWEHREQLVQEWLAGEGGRAIRGLLRKQDF